MILNKKETTIAYRCPSCGSSVMSLVGIFALSGDMIKLKCPCGESELVIAYTKDKKIRLVVPCLICPKPHNYTISGTIFFERDIFTLSCSFSGVNMCHIGKQDEVMKSLQNTERSLLEMLGGTDLDDFDNMRTSQRDITDPHILDIIIYVIRDLEADQKIKCRCLNRENNVYDIRIEDTCVTVSCPKCEADRRIPTDSLINATNFLHCDSIELT